ncbi:plasmid mobilization protein [Olleya sp. R77988]|uniref:plasmid mobilization protein n=1 Tax=Olleya sp. R77988 TaxID=3093875 RepID=UPI0037C6397F
MKNKRLHIRVSSETKTILEQKVKKHNCTISQYITSLIRNKTIKVQDLPDEHSLKLKVELSIIGKNLWTLIKFNKTLKLSEKINLEMIITDLKKTTQSITAYYDRKNSNRI